MVVFLVEKKRAPMIARCCCDRETTLLQAILLRRRRNDELAERARAFNVTSRTGPRPRMWIRSERADLSPDVHREFASVGLQFHNTASRLTVACTRGGRKFVLDFA